MKLSQQELAQAVTYRDRAFANDTPELQAQRKKWVNQLFLLTRCSKSVQTCEMYYREDAEPLKTAWDIPQFFNRWHNTRKKLPSETCAEIDGLPLPQCKIVIQEIVLSLARKKIHFAVFYAQGQRSPHIRIYDFFQLEDLNAQQREKAQLEFWKSIAPWFTHYFDRAMWQDEQPYQLEFAPHWKYGSPFKLMLEFLPTGEKNAILEF